MGYFKNRYAYIWFYHQWLAHGISYFDVSLKLIRRSWRARWRDHILLLQRPWVRISAPMEGSSCYVHQKIRCLLQTSAGTHTHTHIPPTDSVLISYTLSHTYCMQKPIPDFLYFMNIHFTALNPLAKGKSLQSFGSVLHHPITLPSKPRH